MACFWNNPLYNFKPNIMKKIISITNISELTQDFDIELMEILKSEVKKFKTIKTYINLRDSIIQAA